MGLDPARELRALRVVEELLPLAEPERRARADSLCGDDVELRSRVDALLGHEAREDLQVATDGALFEAILPAGAAAADGAPAQIGPYCLVERLGEGGMGTVWLAERADDSFRQRVAVKLVKRGMDTDAIVARFRRERQVLADLQHPNIARLLDGGATEDGRPYLVMELVEGRPIDEFCRAQALSIEAQLELFVTVCTAVEAAHAQHVVHRDLKPANILVTEDGAPKLLDFGIAKLLDDGREERALLTLSGDRLLTPRYASPEQVRGEAVTVATDVYALGVLLYELLTGRPAHDLGGATARELESAVCDAEPPRPSAVADVTVRRRVRGDLDTIVRRAMAKDPARRYASAADLAGDVRRHLDGRPIRARPDTVTCRVGKFVRRNRLLVAATLAVFVVLVAGLIASLLLYGSSERNLARFLAMRDVPLAGDLLREAEDELWPIHPSRLADFEAWLARADDVLARLPARERELAQLLATAPPLSAAQLTLQRDLVDLLETTKALSGWRPGNPGHEELLQRTRGDLRRNVTSLGQPNPDLDAHDRAIRGRALATARRILGTTNRLASARPLDSAWIESLETGRLLPMTEVADQVAQLEARRWHEASADRRFLYETAQALVGDLVRLRNEVRPDVAHRRDRAATLADETLARPAARWSAAAARVGDDVRFAGMELRPIVGLVPLGPDPASGLEEFAHVLSGAPPLRGADGRLQLVEESGIVLVLVPGGSFVMGAQATDANAPNYDTDAWGIEGPPHEIALGPFLISKYELTRMQHTTLAIASKLPAVPETTLRPSEGADWRSYSDALRKVGLQLPTEAQWEYAARAGTTTPHWPGSDPASLAGCCNLADQSFARAHPNSEALVAWDDGYADLSPVGAFHANPFGLHDMLGNVREWVRDWSVGYGGRVRSGDALRAVAVHGHRVWRGGSFAGSARQARCTYRGVSEGAFRIGCRPGMALP